MNMLNFDRAKIFFVVFGYCSTYWVKWKFSVLAIIALTLTTTAIESITPILLGNLIDAITSGHRDQAIETVTLIIACASLLVVVRFINIRMLFRSSLHIMRVMAEDGLRRVQRLSTDWHSSTFSGTTVRNIIRGVWGYDALADALILGLLPAAFLLLMIVVLMFWHWSVLGAAMGIGAVAYIGAAIAIAVFWIGPAMHKSNQHDSKMSGTLSDIVTCNSVVKSFASESREIDRFRHIVRSWHHSLSFTWSRQTASGLIQNGISLTLQVSILVTGLWLWDTKKASAGDITYILTTFTLLIGYLREFYSHFRNLQRAVSDMEALASISALPPGVEDRLDATALVASAGQIRFEGVDFRYPSMDRPLYSNLSLDVSAGARIGLVGPSGSGKSTFVKLVQRLYDLDGGRILIDGQDISKVTQQSLREAVTVVPQDPVLFHRSLAENIAYAKPNASHAEIIAAATRANAHDFISALPQGYDTLVGERGVKLSGGERQRVALARAVLSDAKILILDEATSSLDSVTEHLLQEAIKEVTRDRTTIIIAHRLSTVQQVDRILLFDQGRILEDGDHRALLSLPDGHYRRLFDTQVLGLIRVDATTLLEAT